MRHVDYVLCWSISVGEFHFYSHSEWAFNGHCTFCSDIDECATAGHGCSQDCVNSDGNYTCACHVGFQLLGDQQTCAGRSNIRQNMHAIFLNNITRLVQRIFYYLNYLTATRVEDNLLQLAKLQCRVCNVYVEPAMRVGLLSCGPMLYIA